MDLPAAGFDSADLVKIENMALFYDSDGILVESFLKAEFLKNQKCYSERGGVQDACTRYRDGAAFALWSRVNEHACWKTLRIAKGRPKEFKNGVRDYYNRQAEGANDDAKDIDKCEPPPEPTRCKLAKCSLGYDSGLAFRPLTDLGVALPLGTPSFGFKPGASGAFQATAGVSARYFIANGNFDLRIGAGISNAVGADGMTSTAALAWTVQVGLFEMLGIGFLGLTNPENRATGKALVFSVDLAGVRDQIEDKTK